MKIKLVPLLAIILLANTVAKSQDLKKQEDIKSIKSMCGCFEVKFNFAEYFQYAKDSITYKPSKSKHENGLEWIELVENEPNKIVLQHLLITGKTEESIVKHWRQDWLYENTNFYSFFKNKTWKFNTKTAKEVKGQWTQKVFQVDDSPRYEGTATWIHADGANYWKNTTDAPLPRREYTKRDDYNVLKRRNSHEITKTGWIHEQDNDKLIRDDQGNDVLLAQEKGLDVYTKVADSKCKIAQEYWKKNKEMWKKIRNKWELVYEKNKDLSLQKSVDEKPLYTHLFDLKPDATQTQIDAIIDAFIVK